MKMLTYRGVLCFPVFILCCTLGYGSEQFYYTHILYIIFPVSNLFPFIVSKLHKSINIYFLGHIFHKCHSDNRVQTVEL